MITLLAVLVSLGDKPWCSVLPNTKQECHALDKADCNGVPAKYCIWDSKAECEKNKLYSDEKCEELK